MNKYKKIKKLGQGGFGIIIFNIKIGSAWLVEDPKSKRKLVIKIVNCRNVSAVDLELAKKEALVLQKLRHPNIVAYYDSFMEGGQFHIVMEYADGGDLQQIIDNKNKYFFKLFIDKENHLVRKRYYIILFNYY